MKTHILFVEDNDLLRRSLAFNLESAGYQVTTAIHAENAFILAQQNPPDLILLDIGLPGIDGLDALPKFREQVGVPIIFLTGRRRQLDEALGLELGADDYITKPFDESVLLARIKAVLRRTKPAHLFTPASKTPLIVGDLSIDLAAHVVRLKQQVIALSPREFALLHTLMLEAGHVVSIDELLTRIWGVEYVGQPQVVYVHIRWLREKLEQSPNRPQRIITVRGIGYRLQPVAEKC